MPDPYQLAPDVLHDLEAIFDYTIDRWGIEQAHRYKSKISLHLKSIAQGKARLKTFLSTRPELQVRTPLRLPPRPRKSVTAHHSHST